MNVPGYESWWDVPVAEVSEMPTVQAARKDWLKKRAQEKYYSINLRAGSTLLKESSIERIDNETGNHENTDLLRLVGICKSFPGVRALDNVHLEVRRGEVHALLGENGAGKSTLMKILSGAYARDKGDILWEGQKVEIREPKDAEKLGIGIIYQEFNLVPQLSIAENVWLGTRAFQE